MIASLNSKLGTAKHYVFVAKISAKHPPDRGFAATIRIMAKQTDENDCVSGSTCDTPRTELGAVERKRFPHPAEEWKRSVML